MVYYLSSNEKKRLFKGYLNKARRDPVSDMWRGWSWDRPPIEPPYDDITLSIYEVAGQYCESGRDIYLRRVEGIRRPPNPRMLRGYVLHRVVEEVVTRAKVIVYSEGRVPGQFLIERLMEDSKNVISKILEPLDLSKESKEQLKRRALSLWRFETWQIGANLDRVSSSHREMGLDALANIAIPFVVEHKLDGSFLGLSGELRVDAISMGVVLDLKTGQKSPFQELYTTGYALVLEALNEIPYDVGCLVTLDFTPQESPIIKRWFHLIDEPLRQQFIEERDEKMRIVAEQEDPGVSKSCPPDCPYSDVCGV